MLAALLCNLPDEQENTAGRSKKEWFVISGREDYEKIKKKAKRADKEDVKKAIRILKGAPSYAPSFVGEAIEAVELYQEQPTRIAQIEWVKLEVMIAYYAFIDWRKKDEEDIAALLLLI